jgi:acyl-CoA thioester hydrolase
MRNLEDLKNKLLSHQDQTKVKVRFNDTDAMEVVHFMNYMMYFDDGFVSFMNSLGSQKKVEELIYEDIALGVKNVNITYEGMAKFGDYLIIHSEIKKIGTRSITFFHQIFRESDKEKVAEVTAVRFAMDLSTEKLINILDFFHSFLK